jgi:preprotein translocase subunit SecA
LIAEEEHIINAIQTMLDQTELRLKNQIEERLEAVDTFFEALSLEDEADTRTQRQLLDELSAAARLPIRLTNEQLHILRTDPQELLEEVRAQVKTALFNQTTTRILGAVERRLEDSLELDGAQVPINDWDSLLENILNALQLVLNRRRERLVGNGNETLPEGQIKRDLVNILERTNTPLNRFTLLELLMVMPQGARTTFDKRTHRRLQIRTNRLIYTYYAASLLQGKAVAEITQDVLEHLEHAQENIILALGITEWNRLAPMSIADLDEKTQRGLETALGELEPELYRQSLQSLPAELRDRIIPQLGRQALTTIYRQLMLAVITELWVEYLTQMEALRVSIGLEAYAQRDPLVQYKNRASELFQQLLANMRTGVISRMFTYHPRALSSSARGQLTEVQATEPEKVAAAPQVATPSEDASNQVNSGKKRRRRKHR